MRWTHAQRSGQKISSESQTGSLGRPLSYYSPPVLRAGLLTRHSSENCGLQGGSWRLRQSCGAAPPPTALLSHQAKDLPTTSLHRLLSCQQAIQDPFTPFLVETLFPNQQGPSSFRNDATMNCKWISGPQSH